MMTQPSDRINASADRVVNLSLDKEALAVLALNDAAVRSKQGQFLYLPEFAPLTPLKEKCTNGQAHSETRVPNLLYAHHLWTELETRTYCQLNDANRYLFIQGML